MTSRERVLCALNHEEPDRVPIFLGASEVPSLPVPPSSSPPSRHAGSTR
jgi:hypothetical protein